MVDLYRNKTPLERKTNHLQEKEKTVEAIKALSESKKPGTVFVITEGSTHGFIDCLSRL